MKINKLFISLLHHQNKTIMTTITVAKGDGIGPEIMNATLGI
jgi:hypothetical protein